VLDQTLARRPDALGLLGAPGTVVGEELFSLRGQVIAYRDALTRAVAARMGVATCRKSSYSATAASVARSHSTLPASVNGAEYSARPNCT
jgi:hypothetical protein